MIGIQIFDSGIHCSGPELEFRFWSWDLVLKI